MQVEIGVLLPKAGAGQEGAWCLQEGPDSTSTPGRRGGSCAPHLHPRQAELGDNPMMMLCKGTAQPQGLLPPREDPRKEELEGAANHQVAQMAFSLVLLLKSHCPQPTHSREETKPGKQSDPLCALRPVSAWELGMLCTKGHGPMLQRQLLTPTTPA